MAALFRLRHRITVNEVTLITGERISQRSDVFSIVMLLRSCRINVSWNREQLRSIYDLCVTDSTRIIPFRKFAYTRAQLTFLTSFAIKYVCDFNSFCDFQIRTINSCFVFFCIRIFIFFFFI